MTYEAVYQKFSRDFVINVINYTEMAYINDIKDQILCEAIHMI